ncbi:hypothetical protein DICVIV_04411 [Dictyocaulus viviparus]|uniref:Uncharacterized protein n=1 Tax=Dictyocaulus viviparus TaxID=29172 RepID=A0A0D8Y0B8_DICVI|nr:hypothetical protein DICVIV_04411 [Dictyocaulus viviparus]
MRSFTVFNPIDLSPPLTLSHPQTPLDEMQTFRYIVTLLGLNLTTYIIANSLQTEEEVQPSVEKQLGNPENNITSSQVWNDKNEKNKSHTVWPPGEYCIMPGPSLQCPNGFINDFITLTVPVNFGVRERYHDKAGELPYIRLGNLGGFNLNLREYDQAYILRLNTCCKIKQIPNYDDSL